MTTEADLLRAVLAEPDDDVPRLVLADWLEEYGGEDDRARAEFIRVQCELADPTAALRRFVGDGGDKRLIFLRRRERELLRDNLRTWFDLPSLNGRGIWRCTNLDKTRIAIDALFTYRRGFVELVTLDAAAWLQHGDDLLAAAPLREVRLTTWPDHLLSADLYHATVDFLMPGGRPPVSVRVSGPAWESSPRDVWTAIRLAWNSWWSATGIRFHFPAP